MQVYINENGLNILTKNNILIDNIQSFYSYGGDHYDIIDKKFDDWVIDGNTIKNSAFTLSISEYKDNLVINGQFNSKEPMHNLIALCFFKGQIHTKIDKIYHNSGYTFNDCVVNDMQSLVSIDKMMPNQMISSVEYTCLINKKTSTVIGQKSFDQDIVHFNVGSNGQLEIYYSYKNKEYNNNCILLDEVIFLSGNNSFKALEKYSNIIYKTNKKINNRLVKSITGWCSWYYYGQNISEDTIKENVNQIKKNNIDIDYVQIDDGWFTYKGDWVENDKFPSGMKNLAEYIKKEGYIPGIWVAPFTACKESNLYKNHPEYFVKEYDSSEPYGYLTLDLSQKAVCKYIYVLFHKLSYEWGYRYIKIDYVSFCFSAGRYSDINFTGLKNFKKGFEIIRKAITKDTKILACTSPLMASIGQTHLLRTSMDIFEKYESLREVAKQVLLRSFLQKNVVIDPDCIMIRTSLNEDESCFRLCTRNEKEIQTFLSFIACSSGNIVFSDKLILLSSDKINDMKRLLPLKDFDIKVLDFDINSIPSIIEADINKELKVLFYYNWSEFEETYTYKFKNDSYIYDYWNEKYLSSKEGSFAVKPHECKVLHISRNIDVNHDKIIP